MRFGPHGFTILLVIMVVRTNATVAPERVQSTAAASISILSDTAGATAQDSGSLRTRRRVQEDKTKVNKPKEKDHRKEEEEGADAEVDASAKAGDSPRRVAEKEWAPLKNKLFVCRHAPAVCSPELTRRLRYALIAAAKMHHDVWGIGGRLLSFLGMFCLFAGIAISKFLYGESEFSTKDEFEPFHGGADCGEEERSVSSSTDEESEGSDDGFVQFGFGHEPQSQNGGTGANKVAHTVAVWWRRNLSRNLNTKNQYQAVNHDEDQHQIEGLNQMGMTFLPHIKGERSVPRNPTLRQSISQNVMTYWTDTTLTFTEPLLTFKMFLTALIAIELNDIMAPEQSMLATPEVVAIFRAKPAYHAHVPHFVDWLMPGINSHNADSWIAFLQSVRALLLCSWFTFLLLPKRHALVGGASYALGAVLYVYLGAIGLMYDLAHSTQGGMLFILAASFAVPFLETNPRAAHWLRKFLYIAVLVPIYLFSGISKFRYEGVISNLTGKWLWKDFSPKKAHRAVLPGPFVYIYYHHWISMLMSWGNILTELVLPMGVMLFTECAPLRLLFHFAEITFHFTIFLLLGPNFARYCLMHILASDPLGYLPHFARRKKAKVATAGPEKWEDWARVGLAIFILLAWFRVQIVSDIGHLMGKTDRLERPNPYFPIPELSMFAHPSTPNFSVALSMVVASFLALAIDMVW